MQKKKAISLLLVLSIIIGMFCLPLHTHAATADAMEHFAQNLDELNDYAQMQELETEQMIEARVIVRSSSPLTCFGNARFIRGYRDLYVFQYTSVREANEALDYYRKLPAVKWAQADKKQEAKDYLPFQDSVECGFRYLENLNMETARVNVALIDTGINVSYKEHQVGRLINSGYNTSTSGYSRSAEDDEGHGTNVCSVILENSPESVYITGYKALNKNGQGDDLSVAMCIDKAVADGNSIINLSLGGEGETEPCLKEALQRAFDAGVMIVVAAGNENVDVSTCSPACEEQAVCVAAIDDNGNPESYSNYGEGVDFTAPGTLFGGGTSFSAPYITAVAATVKSIHPEYSEEQIEVVLRDSCYQFEELNWHDSIHRIEGLMFAKLNSAENYDFRTNTQYLYPCEDERLYYGAGMPNFAVAIGMEQCEAVSFSIVPGHYETLDLTLTLSCEADSTIYYADDGSFPTREAIAYTPDEENPQQMPSIPIEGIYSIRAIAYKEGKAPSILRAGEYFNEHLADEADFTINEKGVISEYSGSLSSIIVPASINGIAVNEIGSDFSTPNTSLTCLSLADTVSKCSNNNQETNAFDALVYFKALGLKDIGSFCFYHTPLCVIEAPNVLSIGSYAFSDTLIQTADFPYAGCGTFAFEGCKYLKSADFSRFDGKWKDYTIQKCAFQACIRLKSVKTNPAKNCIVSRFAFLNCYSLRDFDFSNVTQIYEGAFTSVRGIKAVIAPKLVSVEGLPYSTELLYAPCVSVLKTFPFAGQPLAVVPRICTVRDSEFMSKLREYPPFYNTLEDLTFCAAEDAGAQSYAQSNRYGFLTIPAIVSEPENMGSAGGVLAANVIGINLSYQWYGTNVRNNRAGTLLEGENARQLNTAGYSYRYYYCEVTHFEPKQSSFGEDYIKTVKTGYSGEDVNADNVVDIADISFVLANLALSVDEANDACDVDRNNIIDIADIATLLFEEVYGKAQSLSALELPTWQYMYDGGL